MRDETKVSVDAQQRLARPNIFIYTSSGIQLAEIPVSNNIVVVYCRSERSCVFAVSSGLVVG